jgi:hypothetical protein
MSVAQPLRDRHPELAQRMTSQPLVQHAGHLGHRTVRQAPAHLDEHGAHDAAVEREHEQQPIAAHLHELEPTQHARVEARRQRDAELLGEDAEALGRTAENGLDRGAAARDVLAQPLAFGHHDGARWRVQQRVHVGAIGLVRRDATSRRVRMREKPLVLEVAHRVPDRGWRDAEAEAPRQHP